MDVDWSIKKQLGKEEGGHTDPFLGRREDTVGPLLGMRGGHTLKISKKKP